METETSKRPNAALINREWFDSAASILNDAELGRVLAMACRYVFGGMPCGKMDGKEGIVFAMIRPALDSDIRAYAERCARNAANARNRSQRVAASGSDWERVGAIPTPTTTPTTTPTQISLPREGDKEQRDRERFFIALYFAERGSESPVAEMEAFWNYYESLGWKNNKGAPIVRKQAAASMWRPQFALGDVDGWRVQWLKALHKSKSFDLRLFSDVRGAEVHGDVLTLYIVGGKAFADDLEAHCLPFLSIFVADMGAKALQYQSI